MDKDLLRDRFTGQEMNSLHRIVVVLATIALMGSIGGTFGTLEQNQALAQGVIVPEREEQFNKLSEQFQQDVSDIVSGDPPSEDKLATLFDNYKQETFRIFELEPPDPDAPSAGDPPSEVDPPDPDKS